MRSTICPQRPKQHARNPELRLVRDGVHGVVILGTVGENNSLNRDEKRAVLEATVKAVGGQVPIIAGVSEFTTASAVSYARDAERIGITGLIVLPAMVYVPTAAELEMHFRTMAQATSLPIMLYINPPAYRVNIDMRTLEHLALVRERHQRSGWPGSRRWCVGALAVGPSPSRPVGRVG